MSPPSFNLIGQQTTGLLQGLCFPNFQKAVEHSYGCHGKQVSIFKRCLDLTDVSPKFQFDWPANNIIIAESLFSHFLGSLFSKFSKSC